jgi:putative ABC transport system permease protein
VGDRIEGPNGPLEVRGIAAFPAIGQATSSHPGMGEGALFTSEGLDPDEAQPSIAFVDLADGVDTVAAGADLAASLGRASDGGYVTPFGLLHPAELDGAEDAYGTVTGIAALLGAAALAALAAVVLASVRGRQRELAILRALGFTRADLRRSVRWQALTLSLVAVAIGAPLGIAAGRLVWQAFADTLGVDPSPAVPLVLVLALAVGTTVVAVIAAQPAARWAARLPVAPALRPE